MKEFLVAFYKMLKATIETMKNTLKTFTLFINARYGQYLHRE